MPFHDQTLKFRESAELPLFFRDLRDPQKRRRKILVKTWSTIQDVKNAISIKIQVAPHLQRLYYGPLGPLPNNRTLVDAGVHVPGEILLLDIIQDRVVRDSDLRVVASMSESTPRPLKEVVQQCRRGLAMGYKPELVLDGSGGTYFLHNACKAKIAVFKPSDEEPYAENNPRGYVGGGSLREGVAPGEACLREVAAYLLDNGGFCNVPMTTLVEAKHTLFHCNGTRLNISQGGASLGTHSLSPQKVCPNENSESKKIGSLQEFVRAECTMDDLSPSKITKDEVHKIAILDIRLMNADRNSANLLCRIRPDDGFMELVPIDHGFCLRDVCDVSWMDWCWLDWPQMKEPMSQEIKEYISNIDIDADCQLLKEKLNIHGAALDYFRVSNLLLKKGVESGLSLYEIAILCCRNDDLGEVPSKLEMLTRMASELATSALQNGRWHHAAASRAIAEQLSPGSSIWSSISNSRIFKSASSADMSSLFQYETREDPREDDAPGTAPSSVSDACSDVGDEGDREIDQDDCDWDEWAASLIAGMNIEKKFHDVCARTLHDDDDDNSNSELSSSPHGFWFTKPGDTECFDVEDDSVTWSPHISPRTTKLLSQVGRPHLPIVEDSLMTAGFLLPPPHVGSSDAFSSVVAFRRLPSSKSGMHKSQSFAALHSMNTVIDNESILVSMQPQQCPEEDSGAWRTYFEKFIDLVTARETSAAASAAIRSASCR